MPKNNQSRLYIVTDKAGKARLVDAANASQALRFVSQKDYSVVCATAKQVAEIVKTGVDVEVATAE